MYEVGDCHPGVFGTNVRLNAERHVVVHQVVDVHARGQPLTAEADDLLDRQIELTNAIAVQLARREQVDLSAPRRVSGRPICAAAAAWSAGGERVVGQPASTIWSVPTFGLSWNTVLTSTSMRGMV